MCRKYHTNTFKQKTQIKTKTQIQPVNYLIIIFERRQVRLRASNSSY